MLEALLVSHVVLWIVICVLVVMLIALARQIGVLYERVAPAGALMVNARLKAGEMAPELKIQTLAGTHVSVGGQTSDGKNLLIFFGSPTCPVCKALLPAVQSAERAEEAQVSVLYASDGKHADHAAYATAHGIAPQRYVVSELLGMTYGVSKLPYAVLVDKDGQIISMGIVNSREHIESLFESEERGVASIQDYVARQSA